MNRVVKFAVSLPLFLLSLAILILTACTPTWFSDSQRFLYTQPQGRVFIRDFKQQTSQELKLQTSTPLQPFHTVAISSDDKMLATTVVKPANQQLMLHFEVFDIEGKPLFQTEPIACKNLEGRQRQQPMFVYCAFSPDKQKLVAALPAYNAVVTHHIPRKKSTVYAETQLFPGIYKLVPMLANSPISPDSKGLVAIQESKLVFIRLDNHQVQAIDSEVLEDQPHENLPTDIESRRGVRLAPLWKNEELLLPVNSGHIVINTKTLKATYQQTERMRKLFQYSEQKSSLVIGAMGENAIVYLIQEPQKKEYKLFIVNRTNNTIEELGLVHSADVFPSPDGKHAIVFAFGGKSTYLVINRQGEIVDRVKQSIPALPRP